MPKAGFYPIQNTEIRFGKDGHWYGDGDVIDNPRIAQLFSSSVERDPNGGYRLRVGDEIASIVVDDTPYVVTAVTVSDRVAVTLNDGTVERIDPDALEVGEANVFYCPVKQGAERARFLRPAHYQLAAYIDESSEGGFVLQVDDRAFPIRTA